MGTIRRLSRGYAGVAATAALVLALGMGGAYAANKISSKQITQSAVKSKHIKDGGVRTNDLAGDIEVASARTANTANSAKTADTAKRAETAGSVAPNAVNSAAIADGTVGTGDLANESVTSEKIRPGTVAGHHILDRSLSEADIGAASIGADELKGVVATRSSSGQAINPGQAKVVTVECPPGKMVIGAGYAWTNNSLTSIVGSAPSETNPKRIWHVTGFVPSTATGNTLFAWANCLDV